MTEDPYLAFLRAKARVAVFDGIDPGDDFMPGIFPHQRDLTRWSLKKGRAALFAATGLGKTRMELEWARHVARRGRVLVLTPLAVAQQHIREGAKFGIEARYMREDDGHTPIVVTNYEMLDRFDPAAFVGVVADESGVMKNFNGATRNALISTFANTPYRLAATATPAPNDFTELGNHSEFLGVKTRLEMLSEFFVHDGGSTQDWRLKGHATTAFWKWVASWGAIIQLPSDLGYEDGAYALPPLRMHEHVIPVDVEDAHRAGQLFAVETRTLSDQRANRRATMSKRVAKAAELAAGDDPCIVWAELNDEADQAEAAIAGSVQVEGSQSPDEKAERLVAFADGKVRVMVTKAKVAGYGLNWQHCSRMVFLGASHSFEQVYQSIRRCWRFGQGKAVDVHIIRAENEGAIMANYKRKEAQAVEMADEMRQHSREAVLAEVRGATGRELDAYEPRLPIRIPSWLRTDLS